MNINFLKNNQPTIVINFCISKYKPITSFAFPGGATNAGDLREVDLIPG